MKRKWKYKNEILAAIVLTGTMLFAPMNNYAFSGVNDESYNTVAAENDEITNDSPAIGEGAVADYGSTAVGNLANANLLSTAIGHGAEATDDSTAVGEDTVANDGSIAVGKGANADDESIAVGLYSAANKNAIAVGIYSEAFDHSTAVGIYSGASNESTAVGEGSTASDGSVAIGYSAYADSGSVALGNYSEVQSSDILTESNYTSKNDWDADVSLDAINGVVSIGRTSDSEGPAISRRLINVANGRITSDSTDAVNGSQLYAVWQNLQNQISNPNPNPDPDSGSSDFQLVNGQDTIIDKNGDAISVAGETTGYKADGNGNISLQVTDPGDGTETKHVVITDVASAQKLNEVDERVTQNTQNIEGLKQSVNQLDSRIDRVGAGAAALAALHPLDFDPEAKWDFAAGYGNYHGANAIALGTYYRPNEMTMFSIGGSFGGGENMVNAGVSIKIGRGSGYALTSRVAMAKTIKTMQEEMSQERIDTAKKIEAMQHEMNKERMDMANEIKEMRKEMETLKAKNA